MRMVYWGLLVYLRGLPSLKKWVPVAYRDPDRLPRGVTAGLILALLPEAIDWRVVWRTWV